MEKYFDLTTAAGFHAANAYVDPLVFAFKLVKKIFSPEESNARQAKVACELIRRGKENGLKHLEIELDAENFAGLDIPIEGVSIKTGTSGKGKIKIIASYR